MFNLYLVDWSLWYPVCALLQVQSSVWIDVATREITDDIDYAELEKLFSAETQEAKHKYEMFCTYVHGNSHTCRFTICICLGS